MLGSSTAPAEQAHQPDSVELSSPGRTVFEIVHELLTLNGRDTCERRIDSLSAYDEGVFRALSSAPNFQLTPVPPKHATGAIHKVYINSLGRVHIRPIEQIDVSYPFGENKLIGYFDLPNSLLFEAESYRDRQVELEDQSRKIIFGELERAEQDGSLSLIVENILDAILHVETVLFYCDDALIGVSEQFTNAVSTRKGPGIFGHLSSTPLLHWNQREKLVFGSLHALYLSGKSIRFEEFNGCELTARKVIDRLIELGKSYAASLGLPFSPPNSFFALGRLVGYLALQLPCERVLRFRQTHGMTFQKVEHLIPFQPLKAISDSLVEMVERLAQDWLNCALRSRFGLAYVFLDLVKHAVGRFLETQSASLVELLIEELVISAVRSTKADYGMSSSLRDPGFLFAATPLECRERILNLNTKDFFCCIVANSRLASAYGSDLSKHVFRPVQARMQFNRWHFIAGNLPRSVVPSSRHYFFPPLTPDITSWSDQFHAAHSRASVRYAIRAPGPDIAQPPLIISGVPHRAFYDCRVVRALGDPFAIEDMLKVRCHSLFMGLLWQEIIENCRSSMEFKELNRPGFAGGQLV
jgi:hypothetical protein